MTVSTLAPARATAAVASNSYRRNWFAVKPSATPFSATSATILTPSKTSETCAAAASAGASANESEYVHGAASQTTPPTAAGDVALPRKFVSTSGSGTTPFASRSVMRSPGTDARSGAPLPLESVHAFAADESSGCR